MSDRNFAKNKKRAPNRWDIKSLEEEAAKYSTLFEWRKKSSSSYATASRLGIIDTLSKNMDRKRRTWTKEEVLADALLYKSKAEWRKNSKAYQICHKNGWTEEACNHMKKPVIYNKVWFTENIIEEAKKFSSRLEWQLKSNSSYQAAQKQGLLNQATSHMLYMGGISGLEKELLSIIKEKYLNAGSSWFKVEDKKFSPAKRFQLDIYIPELKKGIEFNGDYWHSTDGLKRGRPNWKDDDIIKYHDLKKLFFKSKDINVFEVWEKDWKKNKKQVLKKLMGFLE